ncbi:FGGY-family carbohydrate kinase, partial [Parabacteroides distasonis]|uniref:FGGY-family carbohydrate kinase n=2 Tax=Parabacteroides TaxID=375288 RepID=UPI00325AEDAD
YCEETGQAVPASDADYIHCIFYSLANRYKEVLEILKSMSPHPIERLHVIGGGSRNDLLNQLTANAIGIPVLAGPSEATAIGNCLIQAKSAGLLTDCWEMRRLIATAFPPKEFYPER